MASNGASTVVRGAEDSLEKIKRQLASSSGKNLLQGPLLKRSETLRKWNERWVILDPTTGKMEYKTRRNEPLVKGIIVFDSESTITMSPVNFNGLPKYDGCCFYIGTPQKKDYFLCAETPGAARAWVKTLNATQLVLKAHKEAVNSIGSAGSAKLGTVATVVAAANSIARECSKEIETAMQISLRNALGMLNNRTVEGPLDDLFIMKETLRVKDEELQSLARDLRACDSTIKEIAEKLSETAEAAEAAASAAHMMDEQRRIACTEMQRVLEASQKQIDFSLKKVKDSEEKVEITNKEKDACLKQRDSAIQEANLWRSELIKARERVVILEAAILRAEERARIAEIEAENKVNHKISTVLQEKEELIAYVNSLQSQLQRNSVESSSKVEMISNEENADKACLNDLRMASVDAETIIADVKEVATDTEGSSLDIPVLDNHPQVP